MYKVIVSVIALCLLGFLPKPSYAWDCSIWTSNVPGMECYKAPTGDSNSNSNNQSQDQQQAQSQGQKQTDSSSSKSTATGGSSNAAVSDSGNSASTSGSSSSSSGTGNSTNVDISNHAPRIPVAEAYAASLTSGLDTCLGSVSAGVQLPIVGATLGSTHVDRNCVLIKQVQLLREMDLDRAACFRARADRDIAKAMDAAGDHCPPGKPLVLVLPPAVDKDVVTKEQLQLTVQQLQQQLIVVEQRMTKQMVQK